MTCRKLSVLVALGLTILAPPLAADAQQPGKVWRIGERRHAAGRVERLPELAAELVRLKVDVLVVHGRAEFQAAEKAVNTVPIVIVAVPDPVGTGLVASLARPGGNVTGLSDFHGGFVTKRLEASKT